jgi:hypothetical protein
MSNPARLVQNIALNLELFNVPIWVINSYLGMRCPNKRSVLTKKGEKSQH